MRQKPYPGVHAHIGPCSPIKNEDNLQLQVFCQERSAASKAATESNSPVQTKSFLIVLMTRPVPASPLRLLQLAKI